MPQRSECMVRVSLSVCVCVIWEMNVDFWFLQTPDQIRFGSSVCWCKMWTRKIMNVSHSQHVNNHARSEKECSGDRDGAKQKCSKDVYLTAVVVHILIFWAIFYSFILFSCCCWCCTTNHFLSLLSALAINGWWITRLAFASFLFHLFYPQFGLNVKVLGEL